MVEVRFSRHLIEIVRLLLLRTPNAAQGIVGSMFEVVGLILCGSSQLDPFVTVPLPDDKCDSSLSLSLSSFMAHWTCACLFVPLKNLPSEAATGGFLERWWSSWVTRAKTGHDGPAHGVAPQWEARCTNGPAGHQICSFDDDDSVDGLTFYSLTIGLLTGNSIGSSNSVADDLWSSTRPQWCQQRGWTRWRYTSYIHYHPGQLCIYSPLLVPSSLVLCVCTLQHIDHQLFVEMLMSKSFPRFSVFFHFYCNILFSIFQCMSVFNVPSQNKFMSVFVHLWFKLCHFICMTCLVSHWSGISLFVWCIICGQGYKFLNY